MRLEMLCIRDAKAEAFMTPFFAQSVGSAERMFGDLVNGRSSEDRGAPLNLHPEDFALFWIGTWVAETAEVELKPQPIQVCLALSLVASGPKGVA